MSVTRSSEPTADVLPGRSGTKAAAIAAALFAVSLLMTVASVDVPHHASDSELLSWWQDSGNRTSGVLSGIWAICAAATFAVVINHIRTLTAAARAPHWLAFARSMGAAVTAVWLVTAAARGAIGHLVDVMDEPLPGVDVLRAATAFNYMLLGLSGMFVLALCMLAVSVVVLRTAALGRWIGYVGAGCAAVMLIAVFAQFGALSMPLAILWALCVAVAIWRQPAAAASK